MGGTCSRCQCFETSHEAAFLAGRTESKGKSVNQRRPKASLPRKDPQRRRPLGRGAPPGRHCDVLHIAPGVRLAATEGWLEEGAEDQRQEQPKPSRVAVVVTFITSLISSIIPEQNQVI